MLRAAETFLSCMVPLHASTVQADACIFCFN